MGTRGLETAFALASVLVAQHEKPPMFVPAQEVRTEQPSASPVQCGDRLPMSDRRSHIGMGLLEGLDGTRHPSQNIALPEAVDGRAP